MRTIPAIVVVLFVNLPPGSYRLQAEPPSGSPHVSRSFGHTERFDPLRVDSTMGPLQLSSGEEASAMIELPRAYTIAGRIVVPERRPDGAGRP